MPEILQAVILVLGTVFAMEVIAILAHRYVMHSAIGWHWHKSHHEPHENTFEKNDLYGLLFAIPSAILIFAGFAQADWRLWVGFGFLLYGILYLALHDLLVHERFRLKIVPRGAYLKRLYQAHRMHHAVKSREGCVSFGFLYAPPVDKLKRQLKSQQANERHANPLTS
jgi:beta-carotene 3-hydroxylase